MNLQLERLFDKYELPNKDRHDFLQIFDLLPNVKKTRAIENFEKIMLSVENLREELYIEHEILFGETLDRIEQKAKIIQQELAQNKYMSRQDH